MRRSLSILIGVVIIASYCQGAAVTYHYEFSAAQLRPVELETADHGRRVFTLIEIPSAPVAGLPGQPLLPHRPLSLLLPQGEELDAIQVDYGTWTRLAIGVTIAPEQHSFPLSSPEAWRPVQPDPRVYDSSEFFPKTPYSQPKIFWCKGYQLLSVNLFPLRYQPSTGTVETAAGAEVTIYTRPSNRPAERARCRGLASDAAWVASKVDNPQLVSLYREEPPSGSQLNRDQFEYVIITTAALAGAANPNNFQDFLAFKATRGLTGTIKTVEAIYAEYPGATNHIKIRNFCIAAYENWNTEWILLGADVGGIPARGCYASSEGYEDSTIPTDMYYGCLDGTWDYSGDGVYGEIGDGPDGGEVDVYAELFVGRASVDSATELRAFVAKTLAYETADYAQEWADNALLLGEYLWTDTYGDDYMMELWHGSDLWGYSTPGYPATWDIDRLFEREGNWSSSQLITFLNSNNLQWVNHLGHASEGSVMKLYTSSVTGLTNTVPFITYSQGCYAGAFDTGDCIAEAFSVSSHGAFAVLMNGRYGWGEIGCTDGSGQYFHRQFHDAFFSEGIRELGKMNQDSKEDNVWCLDYKANRWTCYEMNLLGCPQTPVHGLVTTRGTFAFDRTSYTNAGIITCTVKDVDLNADPDALEQTTIEIITGDSDDLESVVLTETEPNSSIFIGSIDVVFGPYTPDNGQIDAGEGDLVTGTYIDADTGFGGLNVAVTDQALIDSAPPQITGVAVTHLDDTSVTLAWTTDEATDSTITYRIAPDGAWQSWNDSALTLNHEITVTGLEQCLDYECLVASADPAGNSVIDDNAGAYYSFTTMIPIQVLWAAMDQNPNWTISGGDWQWGQPTGQPSGPGHDPTSGYDGLNVYGTNLNGAYQTGAAYYLTTPALDCSAASETRLSFYRWLDINEYSVDKAAVQVSTNGTTWTTLYENPMSNFYEYRWTKVTYDLADLADGEPQVYIRWVMGPSSSGDVGGWNLDNIEVSYPAPCNVPILVHHDHTIDDSAGNNDGQLNPTEAVTMAVVLRNLGLEATVTTAALTTSYSPITITEGLSEYGTIPQGGTGQSLTPYAFTVNNTAIDRDAVNFQLSWTSAETSGAASFSEEIVAPNVQFSAVQVLDQVADDDGILDPGEAAQLAITISNAGRLGTENLSGTLTCNHPEWVTISDGLAEYPDIAPGTYGACFAPYYTVSTEYDIPDHTIVEFTLTLSSPTHSKVVTFPLEITTSTFTRRVFWNMDSDPGWTPTGDWAWGVPQGSGGDPTSGYTGDNVYGYNLAGAYGNSLPERPLTTQAIDCSGIENVEVRFMRWLGIESSSYDHAAFQLSRNGTSWTTIWSHQGASFTDPTWQALTYDISQYADNQPVLYLRWVMGTTDTSVTYCGWNLDDVEIWGESGAPRPMLEYDSHLIDDSSGDADGLIDVGETIAMDVTVTNLGVAGTGIQAYLSCNDDHVTITTNQVMLEDVPAEGTGSSVTPFVFDVAVDARDHDIEFLITYFSNEGNGSFSFTETIHAAELELDAITVIDPAPLGDEDGVLDPGETAQLELGFINVGSNPAEELILILTCASPYIAILNPTATVADIPAGGSGGTEAPHFTVSTIPTTPDPTIVTFELSIEGTNYETVMEFDVEITQENFILRQSWNLDVNPGWTTEGQWAWGQPAGQDGDPTSGFTGARVYGYNLAGEYPDYLPETALTSLPINCSTLTGVEVRYQRWLGIESSSYDHAAFKVSNDGATWTTIWNHTGSSFQDTSWSQAAFDISSVADGQATVYLRWTMGPTDGSVTFSGWNLDDIEIWGSSSGVQPTPAPSFTPTRTTTPTATRTASPTPTLTGTKTPTATATPSPTNPASPTPSPTPTAIPTDTPVNTPQPPTPTPPPTEPSGTPTNSPTNVPTVEPSPSATVEPQPTPSPTSPASGMILTLNQGAFTTGDHFILHCVITNAGPSLMTCDAYILLSFYGMYWCWPSWCSLDQELDFSIVSVPAGSPFDERILDFYWPAGAGSAEGVEFYGAAFEVGTFTLIGDLQYLQWRYY